MATAASLFASEVVLYTTSSSPSAPGSMAITNLAASSSTTSLLSFKGLSDPAAHSVDYVASQPNPALGGTGGLVFQLEANKAMLNVYSFQKDHPVLRIILPQKLSCLAASPDGAFVAAGSTDGRIFLWNVATGDLLASFDAHYRSITVLRWSSDAQALVTGSEDARILVWSLAGLLAPSQQSSSSITSSSHNPTPYCTLADHNLAITDIEVGNGAFPHQMTLFSSSLDSTVKAWDVRTRTLRATFAFDHPIRRVVLDPTERFFFASTSTGSKDTIFRVDLFRKKQIASGHTVASSSSAAGAGTGLSMGAFVTPALKGLTTWEARADNATSEPERITAASATQDGSLIPIADSITSLALSLHATFLLVGTASGMLLVIDVSNSQVLKTVSLLGQAGAAGAAASGRNAVTNIITMKRPRDLVGGWEGSSTGSSLPLPIRPVVNFQRQVKGEDDRSDLVINVRIGEQPDAESWIDPIWDSSRPATSLALQSQGGWGSGDAVSSALAGSLGGGGGGGSMVGSAEQAEKVEELSRQVEALRKQLTRAKQVNDEIWNNVVRDRIVAADNSR
ncbi:uncharacterized protein PFL1_00304 [Pseudozyma flocculosa PF-1]|uniref:Pre-rRNA-processing protein IPI3 n=1 Tax=Pseudozyma flocculosa TaxID=84751 RepID=A0A5C3ESY3_9BASI|nr:uncharacterized protein PFL1_00304 [Pseudozyma flocculosa PF-1]EPQ32107.1 hypothetical protein PFL1_00304 [Pseudozyma flocculosa PF-1]SPO34960.1 related to WD-repeat protein crb3 [Pseudozyma flocculosa]